MLSSLFSKGDQGPNSFERSFINVETWIVKPRYWLTHVRSKYHFGWSQNYPKIIQLAPSSIYFHRCWMQPRLCKQMFLVGLCLILADPHFYPILISFDRCLISICSNFGLTIPYLIHDRCTGWSKDWSTSNGNLNSNPWYLELAGLGQRLSSLRQFCDRSEFVSAPAGASSDIIVF